MPGSGNLCFNQALYSFNFCKESGENFIGNEGLTAKKAGSKKNGGLMDKEFNLKKSKKIMRIGLKERYTADKELREILLGTGETELVHFSRGGGLWGRSGLNGKGENLMGVLLMEIRDEIKNKKAF